jgi:hypothetical protein
MSDTPESQRRSERGDPHGRVAKCSAPLARSTVAGATDKREEIVEAKREG